MTLYNLYIVQLYLKVWRIEVMAAVVLAQAGEVLYVHDDDIWLAEHGQRGRSLHCSGTIAGRTGVSSLIFTDDARNDKEIETDKDPWTSGEHFCTLCCLPKCVKVKMIE